MIIIVESTIESIQNKNTARHTQSHLKENFKSDWHFVST